MIMVNDIVYTAMKVVEKLFMLVKSHWDSDLAVVSIGLKQLITNAFIYL